MAEKQVFKKKINKELLKEIKAKKWQKKLIRYLLNNEQETDIDDLCGSIEKAVKGTAVEVLGYKRQKKRKPWFNDQCKKVTEERDKTRLKIIQYPSEENKITLVIKQREVKKIIMVGKNPMKKKEQRS